MPEERNDIQFVLYEVQTSTSKSNLNKYSPSEEFGNKTHDVENILQSTLRCHDTEIAGPLVFVVLIVLLR